MFDDLLRIGSLDVRMVSIATWSLWSLWSLPLSLSPYLDLLASMIWPELFPLSCREQPSANQIKWSKEPNVPVPVISCCPHPSPWNPDNDLLLRGAFADL
jgi:hypothetical protein